MRFLEQLMPGPAEPGTAVRAALRHRFAPERPDLDLPDAAVRDAVTDRETTLRRGPPDVVPSRRDEREERGARVAPVSSSIAATPPHVEPVTSGGPSPGDAPAADPVRLAAATPMAVSPAKAPVAMAVVTRAAAPAPAGRIAPRVPDIAPAAVGRRAPLSERACAERAARPEVEPPTIVQVTIDRIDVRAPAVGAGPEQSGRRKRGGASQSLGDYLRQRDRASGGTP